MWKNSPISYQGWQNTQYGRKNTDSFVKRHVRHTGDFLTVFQHTRICMFFPEPTKCFTEESEKPIQNTQEDLLNQLQPSYFHNRTCTMVLLNILAKPDWVSIHCHQKILSHVVCFKGHSTKNTFVTLDVPSKHCYGNSILKNDTCFQFKYTDRNNICPCNNMNFVQNNSVALFKMIVLATSLVHLDLVYLLPGANELEFKTLRKSLLTVTATQSVAVGGLYCCQSSPASTLTLAIVLLCKSGEYISAIYQNHNRNCEHEEQNTSNMCQQQSRQVNLGTPTNCSPLHFREHKGPCRTFTQQEANRASVKVMFFDCSNGLKIHQDLRDDLISDCGHQPDDEPLYISLLVNQTFQSCKNPLQIPCLEGYPKCYDISDVCVYRLNHHNHLTPCRTAAHMQNCTSFECNGQLKCPLFYCIPLAYICDGKWDCPGGSEEVYNECILELNCTQKFKCRNSKICIHVHDICNGHTDCPLQDDEFLCELKDISCLGNCCCLHFAVSCRNETILASDVLLLPYVSYTFTSCKVDWSAIETIILNSVILRLNFSGNQLTEVPSLLLLKSVVVIDFSSNNVSIIGQFSFKMITKLRYILLSHNQIQYIEGRAFDQLGSVSVVDLANNRLSNPFAEAFGNVETIFLLKVSGNDFSGAKMKSTQELHIDVKAVQTNDIIICCLLGGTKCYGKISWHKSCNDLLQKLSLLSLYIIISFVCIFLNIALVLTSHQTSHQTKAKKPKKESKNFHSIVSTVGAAHLLHCVYLVIIWSSHFVFAKSFFIKEKSWLRNPLCATAFTAELCFNLLMPSLLSFLSLARLDITSNPFDTHFKDHTFVVKRISAIFSSLSAVSICLTALLKSQGFLNKLCMPFVDFTGSMLGVKIITIATAILQVLALGYISVSNHMMLIHMKQSRIKAGLSNKTSKSLYGQIFGLIVTQFLSWVPASCVFVTLHFLPTYPTQLINWTIICGVSINPLVAPVIFLVVMKANK